MKREEAIEILEETGFIAHSMTDVDTALDMAIEALKREPTVIRCKELLSKEDFEAVVKRIHEQNQNVIVIPCEAEVVSTNTSTKSTNISTKSTNASTNTSTEEEPQQTVRTRRRRA